MTRTRYKPVYYARTELDFTEVLVASPTHVKALKGHKTDAKDAVRLLDLYECGAVVRGPCIPAPDLREVRGLTGTAASNGPLSCGGEAGIPGTWAQPPGIMCVWKLMDRGRLLLPG